MKNEWVISFFREVSARGFDKMKNDSVINRKATEFALRIIKAYQFLTTEKTSMSCPSNFCAAARP